MISDVYLLLPAGVEDICSHKGFDVERVLGIILLFRDSVLNQIS